MNINSNKNKTILKYGIAISCGAAVAVYIIFSGRAFSAETSAECYKTLCDAFSVPGLLLILIGALIWTYGQGAFTGIGYLGRYLKRTLIPGGRTNHPHESFYDYVSEKKEKQRSVSISYLFITGSSFLCVGMVFLVLYYINV